MVRALSWPCPLPGGEQAAECALQLDGDLARVLIVPALFDEGNKLRRFTLEVMRRLSGAGVGCVLPDLPGCNESLLPLPLQTPGAWRMAMAGAARHFGCTHVLAMRGGALIAPTMPGWHYAPVPGAILLRQMLRARILSSREAGREESQASLLAQGRAHGLDLAGYRLSAEFLSEFMAMVADDAGMSTITQDLLGGPGLWLRAEAGEDAGQADALAAIIAITLRMEP